MSTVSSKNPSILVVDDTPANLELLCEMLRSRGYKARPVASGEAALKALAARAPDLILLDITMSGMDGYEVCNRIKADSRWKDIPVLFVSALNQTEDKVRAFTAGGVDYISKPFQIEEVDARVRTHLELRRQRLDLEESYARLKKLESLRDSLTHMIVHDMRTPLLANQLSTGLLREAFPSGSSELLGVLDSLDRSNAMLTEMTTQMLDISMMEAGSMTLLRANCDVRAIANEAVSSIRPIARQRTLAVSGDGDPVMEADVRIVRRIIDNLLGNAVKFTAQDGAITVCVDAQKDSVRVEVSDNGRGIAKEHLGRIFEKFGQVDDGGKRLGFGLGLTFCRLAVQAHGGKIGVASEPGKGSTFWFELPRKSGAECSG